MYHQNPEPLEAVPDLESLILIKDAKDLDVFRPMRYKMHNPSAGRIQTNRVHPGHPALILLPTAA